ncbi:MAG: hypothetical protein PVF73_11105, partial [Bacteroidales bacterium]|jgi:hypothetical protein
MKKGIYIVIITLFFLVSIELMITKVLHTKSTGIYCTFCYAIKKINLKRFENKRIEVTYLPGYMYVPDDYLGYSSIPGEYYISLKDKILNKSHNFHVNIGKDGHRITSYVTKRGGFDNEIWIFGDSSTKGWGNNNETSFPFFLQNFLSTDRVINYAENGYGNLHQYLQLKKEISAEESIPGIIVIVYADYFNVRNVAAPSFLKGFWYDAELFKDRDPSKFLYPKASIVENELQIDYINLFCEFNKICNDADPGKNYQYKVTKHILSKIYEIGNQSGSKMILAYLSGNDNDEILNYSKTMGYIISDMRPEKNKNEWDGFSPYDDYHPGPLAQNHYALKLYETIKSIKASSD